MSTPVVRFAPDSLPTSGEVRVSTEPTATRFYGLDWLRAGAAVAVVGLHAAMPYMLHPFPGLHWTTHDPQPSAIVDACGWALNACVMPVFFLMSGFFAARTFTQKSVNDALQHRARRIVFPLIFGCLCILPLSFYVWVLSWVCDGLVPVDKLRKLNIKGPLSENLWGVAHLWYLEYLFLFTVVAWTALRTRVVSWGENHTRLNWSVVWQLSGFVMGTCVLWWEPQILIGFRNAWLPQVPNLLFYAPWFAAGWCWSKVARPTIWFAIVRLGTAVGVFAMVLPSLRLHCEQEFTGLARWGLVAGYTSIGWLAMPALFSLCLPNSPWKTLQRVPPKSVTWIAEASLWIYLFHHPIVGLTQWNLSRLPLTSITRFAIAFSVSLGLSLMTEAVWVRGRWLGRFLNGTAPMTKSLTTQACESKTVHSQSNAVDRAA